MGVVDIRHAKHAKHAEQSARCTSSAPQQAAATGAVEAVLKALADHGVHPRRSGEERGERREARHPPQLELAMHGVTVLRNLCWHRQGPHNANRERLTKAGAVEAVAQVRGPHGHPLPAARGGVCDEAGGDTEQRRSAVSVLLAAAAVSLSLSFVWFPLQAIVGVVVNPTHCRVVNRLVTAMSDDPHALFPRSLVLVVVPPRCCNCRSRRSESHLAAAQRRPRPVPLPCAYRSRCHLAPFTRVTLHSDFAQRHAAGRCRHAAARTMKAAPRVDPDIHGDTCADPDRQLMLPTTITHCLLLLAGPKPA